MNYNEVLTPYDGGLFYRIIIEGIVYTMVPGNIDWLWATANIVRY